MSSLVASSQGAVLAQIKRRPTPPEWMLGAAEARGLDYAPIVLFLLALLVFFLGVTAVCVTVCLSHDRHSNFPATFSNARWMWSRTRLARVRIPLRLRSPPTQRRVPLKVSSHFVSSSTDEE